MVQGPGLLVRGMGVRGAQHGNISFHIDFGWLELFHLVKLRRCECLGALELRCVTGHGGSKFRFFVPQLEVNKKSCLRASEIMSEASQLWKKNPCKNWSHCVACKACNVQDLTVPTLNPRFAAPTADPSQVQMRFFVIPW